MKRWWRRHRFLLAYRILRNEVERHRAAGHDTEFVAVNEARIRVECTGCPDLQP